MDNFILTVIVGYGFLKNYKMKDSKNHSS